MFHIITIIVAIALGAIVAAGNLTAIGDTVFGRSAQAYAQQIANHMAQIESADTIYKQDYGSSSATTTPTEVDGIHDLVDQGYLGMWLRPPSRVVAASVSAYTLGTALDATAITLSITSQDVCTLIGSNGTVHPKLNCSWSGSAGAVVYNY